MKKILLIGGYGYLGKCLKKKLEKYFLIISPKKNNLNILNNKNLKKHINKKLFCIINLTGQIGKNTGKTNNLGNKNIIKTIKEKKINPLLIFFSTTLIESYKKNKAIYQSENLVYAKSKLVGENFLKDNYNNYMILRVSNIYDDKFEKRGIFNNIINSIKKKSLLKISNLNSFRNYIHINDVIDHTLKLLKLSKDSHNKRIVNLINENYSIKNILKFFEKKFICKIKMIDLKTNLKKNYSQKFFDFPHKITGHMNKYKLKKTIMKFNDK